MGGRGHWEGTFLIGGGPPVEQPLLELSAKLHYTDTDYGHVVQHHQRTSSQQFYNLLKLLYNKFITNGQKFATSQHLDMSRC